MVPKAFAEDALYAAALLYNPYEGDFGSPGDRILENKIVVAAKDHDGCHICGATIVKGERHRLQVDVSEGKILRNRWCAACCAAMFIAHLDAGEAICARQGLYRGDDVTGDSRCGGGSVA